MTVRLIEGFDHWNGGFPYKGWFGFGIQGSGGTAFVTGRFGAGTGNFMRITQGNGASGTSGLGYAKALPSNYPTLIVGMAWMMEGSMPSSSERIFAFADSGTEQLSVRVDINGRFYIARNGTTLVTETNIVMQPNVWYYLEFKATFHGSTGSYAIRRNGQTIAGLPDATGVNTIGSANAYANEVRLAGQQTTTNQPAQDYDDLYVFDDAGSTNNDFVGERRVYTLFPTSNGTTIGLTNTGGATNAASVSDNPHTSDTSYVSSAVAGTLDTYTTADLPATAAAVNAVQFNLVARTDDAGARTIAPVVRVSGGAQYDGASTPTLGATYVNYTSLAETSFDTATAWTPAEINGCQVGVKVVS